MISPENDEEFGIFGQSAVTLLDLLFPNTYKKLIIVSPSFNASNASNIAPQVTRGDFFVLSSVEMFEGAKEFSSDVSCFSPSTDVDVMLDRYRYEHAILATTDLSILTAWAQAEYAVIAFRGTILDEYREWLDTMLAIEVVRPVP